jgi:hypothetical protein
MCGLRMCECAGLRMCGFRMCEYENVEVRFVNFLI